MEFDREPPFTACLATLPASHPGGAFDYRPSSAEVVIPSIAACRAGACPRGRTRTCV
jgi:hypothetical protein